MREAKLNRETGETKISVELNIDGKGTYEISTGNGMFNHLLAQLSRHGLIDLKISASGDKEVGWHHIVEDTAILLGRSFRQALGESRGITRIAHSIVPLDEALAMVAVDFGGRGYAIIDTDLSESDMGDLSSTLVKHFLETLAIEGGFNIHVKVLAGINNHHKAESIFKALARATRSALTLDERLSGDIPSTKGIIG